MEMNRKDLSCSFWSNSTFLCSMLTDFKNRKGHMLFLFSLQPFVQHRVQLMSVTCKHTIDVPFHIKIWDMCFTLVSLVKIIRYS